MPFKTLAMPLKDKESLEMMKVVVKYLAGQGGGTSLQLELDTWRWKPVSRPYGSVLSLPRDIQLRHARPRRAAHCNAEPPWP